MFASSGLAVVALLGLAALIFSAAVSDVLNYTIPNRLCLAIVALYPAYAVAAPNSVDWMMSIAIAAAVLLVGFVLFSLRFCGAGDIKLLVAISLWAGPEQTLSFIILTTLAGGAIALYLYFQPRFARAAGRGLSILGPADPNIGQLQMPYGAAIGVAGLYVAFTLMRVS